MPVLFIDRNKILHNFLFLKKLCSDFKLELVTVAKFCLFNSQIIDSLIDNGAEFIAGVNLFNLRNLKEPIKKMLLRTALSDMKNGIEDCDCVLVSELAMLEALARLPGQKKPGAILMLELGDFREGIPPDDFIKFLKKALSIRGVKIAGIGGNLGCLTGRLPDTEMFSIMHDLLQTARAELGCELSTVSMGGTSIFDMFENNWMAEDITQVRMGEAIFFGYNMSARKKLAGFKGDAFIFQAEIIELAEKKIIHSPGRIGYNAFGHKTNPVSPPGMRKRAVLNFGSLAASFHGLSPVDSGVFFAGATHDYSVIDVSECTRKWKVGDRIHFVMNYNSASQAMLNPFVQKKFIDGKNNPFDIPADLE
ncbi:MAG: alanine racemase [Spirochaetales bacterium]|nr:alanine racemase [Spirochaetales bacterium]